MPTPVIPLAADPENETLASALNNFILNFYGAIAKTVVDGEVVWVLPCDLSTAIPGYPRDPSLGTACYFKSLFEAFDLNMTDIEAEALAAQVAAANAEAIAQEARIDAEAAQVSADAAQVSADAALAGLATLGTISTQDANNVSISGGSVTGTAVTGLPAPSAASDAATKQYADSLSGGIIPKESVELASTANLSLTGEQTIDSILTSTSRILVKNQTATEENGIYDTGAGAWTRAADANTAGELAINQYYFVPAGSVNIGTGWFISTAPTVLGADPVTFGQFSAATTYSAGAGLTLTGSQFSVAGTSYTAGDLVYASAPTVLSRLAAVGAGQVLASNGVGAAPFYTSSPSVTAITVSTNSLLGGLIVKGDQINQYSTNATDSVDINYDGYLGGTTQFRDLIVYDGKNAQVAKFTGSTKALEVAGAFDVTGISTLTGRTGIGATASSTTKLRVGGNATGATEMFTVYAGQPIQSDVTSGFNSYTSAPSTAAAVFTVPNLYHYRCAGVTLGAGSAVTLQVGFEVSSDFTAATNNYGYRGSLAAATGRYNLYMDGTAQNYLAGNTGIGALPGADKKLNLGGSVTGAVTMFGAYNGATVQSDVTTAYTGFNSQATTAAAAFTVGSMIHFHANPGTKGAGSTITSQFGFLVSNTLTGAANNYGFYGDIASGSSRYNLYMAGTAQNYLAGNTGIGTAPQTNVGLTVGPSLSGASSYGLVASGTLTATANGQALGVMQTSGTFDTATYTGLVGYGAIINTPSRIGSGTIENYYSLYIASAPTATNKYGLYQGATDSVNYLAGETRLGLLTDMGAYILQVTGNTRLAGTLNVTGNSVLGNLTFKSSQINQTATNGLAEISLNYEGYASGTTQFRDTVIYNGKNAQVAKFDGTSKTLTLAGNLVIDAAIADPSINIYASGVLKSQLYWNGSSTIVGSYANAPVGIQVNGAVKVAINSTGLDVTGQLSTTAGITRRTNVVTTTYTVDTTTTDDIVVANHATVAFTITLVAASTNTGRVIVFKNKGAANATLDATGLGQIDGSNTLTLSQYDALTLISDGTTWNIL